MRCWGGLNVREILQQRAGPAAGDAPPLRADSSLRGGCRSEPRGSVSLDRGHHRRGPLGVIPRVLRTDPEQTLVESDRMRVDVKRTYADPDGQT